jgi:hypothetical protein
MVAKMSDAEAQQYFASQDNDDFARDRRQMGKHDSAAVIVNLTSEKGQQLNGQRCKVIGIDPPGSNRRLRVRTTGGEEMRLKRSNVLVANLWASEPSRSSMRAEAVMSYARGAAAAFPGGADGLCLAQVARHKLLSEYMDPAVGAEKAETARELRAAAPPIRCNDWLFGGPYTGKEAMVSEHLHTSFGACYGNGFVCFEKFSEGLTAAGGSDCPVCLQEIARGTSLCTLPCGHGFHAACVKEALLHQRACPICRASVADPEQMLQSFEASAASRTVMRLAEWVQSGMCERCQMAIIEKQQVGMTTVGGETSLTASGRPVTVSEAGAQGVKMGVQRTVSNDSAEGQRIAAALEAGKEAARSAAASASSAAAPSPASA